MANALREQELAGIRYTLDAICGNVREMWDRVEKVRFYIKGERSWKKWTSEHVDQWATDF